MERQDIIMSFSTPPSSDDLEALAKSILTHLPEEILELCEDLAIRIEELADEAIESELDLDDPFELICLYRSGSEIAPGVTRKVANDDDLLLIFRRPLLDLWCETAEDLNILMRQVMIEELGQNFDFSEDEINEMSQRHYQGLF
ncbi:MAG: metallopeptidase family protein [Micavibrio aeruginosavorus]|uniref:Metallopeptidase family protein n=1 Tax=Micavibrio aeruginosavorus TaxID=349221 RepID=A0A7T5R4I7_9BACT|nr:MAG: metallopeptidase family protein [Micavibrio aeruginosavorus]